jgi:serine/threonine protein kinase/tetratricopeptide (TPR) repeat protein
MVDRFAELHPDPSQLQRWLSGDDLDTETISAIEEHMGHCTFCAARLDAMETSNVERQLQAAALDREACATVRLSEGYEIGEMVGRGASGTVYRAVHRGLGRTVAVKMLTRETDASPDTLARFTREAEALARLNHPNVVRVFDSGEQAGRPYLALEWIQGPTLRQYLSGFTLKEEQAARLVAALAAGVQHAHDQGILHRDLKPDNVLVAIESSNLGSTQDRLPMPLNHYRDEEVDFHREESFKVVDFGLARLSQDEGFHTRTGETLGTPSYMAPEQIAAQPDQLDVRTDVYGLGAILYECLTGRPPLQGNTVADTIRLVIEQDPIPIQTLRPGIHRDLSVICNRCLAKSPKTRFASAADLRNDLMRFISGLPIQSRPISLAERSLKWARKNPWPVVAVGILALAVVATLAVQSIYQRRLIDQRDVAEENYQVARAAIWRIIHAASAESAFDIPRLQQLQMSQISTAVSLFEQLAEQERTPRAERDLAEIRVMYGSALIAEGKPDEGRRFIEKSQLCLSQLVAGSSEDVELVARLAEAQVKQALALLAVGKRGEARQLLEATLPMAKQLRDQHPNDPRRTDLLAWTLHNLGSAIDAQQDRQSAIEAFSAALELRKQARQQAPDDGELLRFLAESQLSLGSIRMPVDIDAAAQDLVDAIETLQQLVQRDSKNMQSIISLAVAYLNYSNILAGRGDANGATQACSQGIPLLTRALDATPNQNDARRYLAMLYGNRAMFASQTGRTADAVQDWEHAIAATDDPAIQEFCELQLIRDLAAHARVDEAAQKARRLAAMALSADARLKLLLAEGTILNACLAAEKGGSDQASELLADQLVASIRQSLGQLADDVATRKVLFDSPDLSSFRSRGGADYLRALFGSQ